MNHITTSTSATRTFFAALLAFAVGLVPANVVSAQSAAFTPATQPTALSATEAVFFAQGILSAQSEAAVKLDELAATPVPPAPLTYADLIGFRNMARNNQNLADLCRFAGNTVIAAYFQGRANTFNELAGLFGEF